MSDILLQLRHMQSVEEYHKGTLAKLFKSAADEIERLQAGVAAERERCAIVAESCDALGPDFNDSELTNEGYIARQKMRQIAAAIRAGGTP